MFNFLVAIVNWRRANVYTQTLIFSNTQHDRAVYLGYLIFAFEAQQQNNCQHQTFPNAGQSCCDRSNYNTRPKLLHFSPILCKPKYKPVLEPFELKSKMWFLKLAYIASLRDELYYLQYNSYPKGFVRTKENNEEISF